MGVVKNIVVPEQYTSKGEEKAKWNNIGSIIEIEKDGKKYQKIKLNNVPIGWDGWGYLFDPKPYDGAKKDSRKEYTQDEYDQSSNDMNSDNGGSQETQDTVIDNIDDKPIDLSEIPF